MTHLNIKVTGKVQGVWFRRSTLLEAQKLGVSGFVRKEPDGSVYIEAEGNEEQLKALLDWCSHGPELARVDKVESVEGTLAGFTVFQQR